MVPMLYCENCKVHLSGKHMRCPLCKGKLTGEADGAENLFPVIPAHIDHAMLMRLSFGSVVVAAVSFAVNLILPARGWWSLFVLFGIVSFWASLALVLKKNRNIPKTVLWQVGALSLLAYIWDYFTGFRGWSLNFVLPILCTSAMVAMSVIARIKKLDIQNYIFYLVINCVFGILSFTLLVIGTTTETIPSAVCFASAIIFLAALWIFQGKVLRDEIQRRFHL